jgi:hypothetical protein
MSKGDLIRRHVDIEYTGLFSSATHDALQGKNIALLKKNDIAIVIDVIASRNPRHIRMNEHVIKIFISKGIGWTWRGNFTIIMKNEQ